MKINFALLAKYADLNQYLSQHIQETEHPEIKKILERILVKEPRVHGARPEVMNKIIQDIKDLMAEGVHSFEDIANLVLNSVEQYPDVYGVMRNGSFVNQKLVTAIDMPLAL